MKRFILYSLIILNVLVCSCTQDNKQSNTNESLIFTQQILDLSNNHRKSLGKPEFVRSEEADALANHHVVYMINQGKISHDNFLVRLEELSEIVNAEAAGENVSYGHNSGEAAVTGWLNSSGHRENIEGNYTHIGIAAIKDKNGRYYYMQLFYR